MIDQRLRRLAQVLVRYSTSVGPGDQCLVEGESTAEPLLRAVQEEVLRAGGHPLVMMIPEGTLNVLYEHASDEQLSWVSPAARWGAEEADVRIRVLASDNPRELSQVDPARQTLRQRATAPLMERSMQRSAVGQLRWVVCQFPTNGYAAEAEMSLTEYENFVLRACLCDRDDPVGGWRAQGAETQRLAEWIEGREEVHIRGPGTDLRLSVAGRHFLAGDGRHNMPCGEFFTGPVEDSANGEVSFHLPTVFGGREVAGVTLRFRAGHVVEARAQRGEDLLHEMLDMDDGARRLGELGVGTNFHINRGTRSILFDEKIGGTVHLALGRSYPESGGINESSLHWDLICDLRRGGSILVDGIELQRDGSFLV